MTQHNKLEGNFAVLRNYVGQYAPFLLPVLDYYKYDKDSTAGLLTAPAGKSMHHAYVGGLVVHLNEMIAIAFGLRGTLRLHGTVSATDFVTVIVLHDLHKAYKTFKFVPDTDSFEYVTHLTNDQMTNNQKSLWMLTQCPEFDNSVGLQAIFGNIDILNALHSSEGGYAKNAPKEQSILAKFCYLCDEASVLKDRDRLDRDRSIRDRSAEYFVL